MLCNSSAAAMEPFADPTPSPIARPRRLWHLSAQAHELLLAMSFEPDVLRDQAARTLGRMDKGVCVLKGREVDVLYSVVQDLAARNPLSEAFQKRLDGAHALALRRFAALPDAESLQAAWQTSLHTAGVSGALWGLLTHPMGAAMERKALYDARAWVFAHGRRSVALSKASHQAEECMQPAQLQLADLRDRLLAQQQQADQALNQAKAEIARLGGEVARLQNQRSVPPAAAMNSACTADAPASPAPMAIARAIRPTQRVSSVMSSPPPRSELSREPTAVSTEPQPIAVRGRRVLCVGGNQHAVAQYRGRIEKLGGHFEHHDGGLEDSVQALEGRLSRADVVICQAACINHEAYRRIKRHCERTDKPCTYLDRPSLSRLDRELLQGPTAGAAPRWATGPAHATESRSRPWSPA